MERRTYPCTAPPATGTLLTTDPETQPMYEGGTKVFPCCLPRSRQPAQPVLCNGAGNLGLLARPGPTEARTNPPGDRSIRIVNP